MNITAGTLISMGLSLAYADIYCLSYFSEENLMVAIDRVKLNANSKFN